MSKEKFLQQYKNGLRCQMVGFESERKRVTLNYLIRAWIVKTVCSALILGFSVLIFKYAFEGSLEGIMYVSLEGWIFILFILLQVITGIVCACWYLEQYKQKINDFLLKMKLKFLNRLLTFWGNITWSVDRSVPTLKAEKIVGEYKNTAFKILETKNDLFLTFKSNKKFKYETIVKTKFKMDFVPNYQMISFICSTVICIIVVNFLIKSGSKPDVVLREYLLHSLAYLLFAIVSGIYSLVSFVKFCIKFNKTKMEDIELTRDFEVYTQDEVEARYFLTPSFIERFKGIQTVFGRKNISCACNGNEISFKITKPKNLFEVCDVFKPLNDISAVSDLYDEIDAIFKMIDYFRMDENIKI